MSYVLGVNIGFHDASAALLADGELRWLVEQERVSRRKHALAQPPAEAVHACLRAEGITPESISTVAVGWDFAGTPLARNRRFTADGMRTLVFGADGPARMPPVRWVPHHLAHAASTYHLCGAADAAILVMDGAGERQATSLGWGHGGAIELVREWPVEESLGFFYTAASRWAGLGDWGTGKLMGLAAYGRAGDGMPVRRTADGYSLGPLRFAEGGRSSPVGMLMAHFPAFDAALRPWFCAQFPFAPREGEDAIAYADFAATVQDALEEGVLGLAEYLRRQRDVGTLALAGGVAMNCTMVGRLVRSGLFDRVYVPPVPTDAGVALGAALAVSRPAPVRLDHAYWGTPLGDVDPGLPSRRLAPAELAEVLAAALADGRIVAYAQGRAEVGQRALGARSLLGDPRDRRTLERLNRVKGREMWRPVAPSVQAEHVADVMATDVGHPGRFMLAAGQMRSAVRPLLPAVTHVDGSARPQVVTAADNPAYWRVLDEFRRRTGVPAVVNTSLNLAGEPIAATAEDVLSVFLRAPGIDLLVLGDRLVARAEAELAVG